MGFPLFEARDSGFESKIGARFGIESIRERWDAKNNPRDYGIARNFGSGLRDWRTLFGTLQYGMLCSCSKAYVMLCQVMLCWATTKQKYLIHCFTVRIKIGFLRHSPIIFMSLPVVKVVKGSKIAFKKILLWHSTGYPFLKIVHLMCKFQTNRMHWIQMSYFSVMIVGEIKLFQASTTTK